MTLGRAVARTVSEARTSLENPSRPLTDASLTEVLGGVVLDAGVPVTPYGALSMPAVYRAVTVVCGVSAALPIHPYDRKTKVQAESTLLDDPHPEMTAYDVWFAAYAAKALWGNGFLQKIRNAGGQVVELWPIRPHRVVDVERKKPTPGNPGGKVFSIIGDDGRGYERTTYDILHLPHMSIDGVKGISPIAMAAQGIGLALAAKRSAARFYGRGAQMAGVLQTDRRLDEDQAKALKRRWKELHGGPENAGDVGILDSGAKFFPLTMPFKDAQHLESRQFEVYEICRMYGVPPFLMFETQKSTSWGTGLEQQALGFISFDLHPVWLAPTEQRITKELLPPAQKASYSLEGLLRGDSTARAMFYRIMREVGAFSANDIRALENRPPVDGGDTYLQPLNMAPLGTEFAPPGGGDQSGDNGDTQDGEPADGADTAGRAADDVDTLLKRANGVGILARTGFDANRSREVMGLPDIPYLPVRPVTVQPIAAAEGGQADPTNDPAVDPNADPTGDSATNSED